MKTEVTAAIEELRRQFAPSAITAEEDGQGGAYVLIESVQLGDRIRPDSSWLGFQIPAQYPYADIYPVFIGAHCHRTDGLPFVPPVTPGHNFRGRAAIQVSRRNGAATSGSQKATAKILKILNYLSDLS